MRLNPEIQKYTWLEFTAQRLLMMPLVLCVVFYIAGQLHNPVEAIISTSITILILLLGVSGGHKAATSVIDELNNNTWDFQRLSPTSPMSLTLGKVIGSTLYNWYGAAMVIAVYIYFSLAFVPAYYVFCNVVMIINGALICHSGALLASLQAIQTKISGRGRIQSIGAHILGAVLAICFVSGIQSKTINNIPQIDWYGQQYTRYEFTAFFSVIAVLWIAGGVCWMMRSQLRMRTGPWYWAAFVIFMMFFSAGFDQSFYGNQITGFVNSYVVGICLLYGVAFIEPWDGLHYRRLLDSWKARNKKNFMNLFPRWLATFILVSIVGLFTIINSNGSYVYVLTVLAAFCFMVRDVALLHFCKLLPNSRRSHAAALFYLLILYVLLPAFIIALNDKDTVALFWLIPTYDHVMKSFVSALVQAALFVVLAFQRWDKYWR